MDLSQFADNHKFKGLIYGDSGAGKTILACSAPGPIFVFDFDNKISSPYQWFLKKNPSKLKEIEFESYSFNKGDNPYTKFTVALAKIEADVSAGKFKYETIVVDSLTFLAEAMMAHVIKSNPNIKGPMPGVPGMQHYGILNMEFKSTIGRILQLPAHVIVIAHIKAEKDDEGTVKGYKPMVSGSLADYLPKIFREVYRAYVVRRQDGVTTHMLQTRNDGRYECRTEGTEMPAAIETNIDVIAKYLGIKMNALKETK